MSTVTAIGELALLEGFALAGVRVEGSDDEEDWLEAWESLGGDVGLVLLTPASRRALSATLGRRRTVLWTVVGE